MYGIATALCALIVSCAVGAIIGMISAVVYAYGFILSTINDMCSNRGVNFHAGLSLIPRGGYMSPWKVC
jgi:hypothetical protein